MPPMSRHQRLRHNMLLWGEGRIERVPDDGGAYWSTYRVTVPAEQLDRVPDTDLIDVCAQEIALTGGKVVRDADGATVTVRGSE
jgi:hypothetical protein